MAIFKDHGHLLIFKDMKIFRKLLTTEFHQMWWGEKRMSIIISSHCTFSLDDTLIKTLIETFHMLLHIWVTRSPNNFSIMLSFSCQHNEIIVGHSWTTLTTCLSFVGNIRGKRMGCLYQGPHIMQEQHSNHVLQKKVLQKTPPFSSERPESKLEHWEFFQKCQRNPASWSSLSKLSLFPTIDLACSLIWHLNRFFIASYLFFPTTKWPFIRDNGQVHFCTASVSTLLRSYQHIPNISQSTEAYERRDSVTFSSSVI